MLASILFALFFAVVGFVVGIFVYRNNTKKLENYIEDWDLENLSKIRKKLIEKKKEKSKEE
ncbi:MAG: hypothetical protein ACOC22_02425 [bacterium]